MAGSKLIVTITDRSKSALDRAYEAYPHLSKREVVDLVVQKGSNVLLGTTKEVSGPNQEENTPEPPEETEESSEDTDEYLEVEDELDQGFE